MLLCPRTQLVLGLCFGLVFALVLNFVLGIVNGCAVLFIVPYRAHGA